MLDSLIALVAAVAFDAAIGSFINFLGQILLLVGIVVMLWAGWLIHDGKLRDGLLALLGGLILALSVPLMRWLISLGN